MHLFIKSIDGVLGIRTRYRSRLVGADGSTELWRPPICIFCKDKKYRKDAGNSQLGETNNEGMTGQCFALQPDVTSSIQQGYHLLNHSLQILEIGVRYEGCKLHLNGK